MESILAKLAEQIPSTIAVIIVVILFLREQARMQKEFSAQLNRLVAAIDGLSTRVYEVEMTVKKSSRRKIRKRNVKR